ncbi:MAG TPA: hypothetical protein PK186_10025 [candidate division Zixibacteria bacterium]|nr:hypothetical protein [candidate division Zixibacteria bacterium]MDD4916641.1 hypothetical protein [candidate division Zixibacteria bacterium]MDM7973427.1 hypothetical protein [candidate division Zixibacteria bacterium]HOD67068.1 hypothetical protein [candidate division Zixibacteria bacterium]HPM37881.1 hypothetical protein [candidate division Zixibacteria bacterium]
MHSGEWLAQARALLERAVQAVQDLAAAAAGAQEWIVAHFGQNGLYAAAFIGAALGLYLILQLIRITLAALKYLVVPGVGLALLGSLVLPFSFFFLLPITLSACSLVLLFKG